MTLVFDAQVAARGFDVRLTVRPGETVAVLGPNGAGKSTLLAVIAGLLRPDGGSAFLGGTRLFDDLGWTPPHSRGISLLAQEPLLFPHLSVLDNVAFGPRSRGAGKAASRNDARNWLTAVNAQGLAGRSPTALSGGEAQRVAVARALACHPRLLLLDEPLAALDVAVAPALRRTLRSVLAGRSAVIVTHDVLDALMLADRVVIMSDGGIVEEGATRDVLEQPRSAFAAGLAGLNFVTGIMTSGGLAADELMLFGTADPPVSPGQSAAAVFSPRAVSVFLKRPLGSPRNVVPVTITDLEPRGGLVHVRAGHLSAEITAAAAADLDLVPGMDVYFVVKSAEVSLYAR